MNHIDDAKLMAGIAEEGNATTFQDPMASARNALDVVNTNHMWASKILSHQYDFSHQAG